MAYTPANTSVANCGDGPKNDGERTGHGKDTRKGLIDLEDSINQDSPLWRSAWDIAQHVRHDVWYYESANRCRNNYRNTREPVSYNCSERNPVRSRDAPSEAAGAQEHENRAYHSYRVRNTRD